MPPVNLSEGIPRFRDNEDRIDQFTNGTEDENVVPSRGEPYPTLRKFLKTWSDTIEDDNGSALATKATKGVEVAAGARAGIKGADIASAATVNLGAATGDFVTITGSTTITSLGVATEGIERLVVFAGAPVLTHNAVSLILLGGANISAAAGDVARFRSLGGGNWRMVNFHWGAGLPLAGEVTEADALAGTGGPEKGGMTARRTKRVMDERIKLIPSHAVAAGTRGTDGKYNSADIPDGTFYFTKLNRKSSLNGAGYDRVQDRRLSSQYGYVARGSDGRISPVGLITRGGDFPEWVKARFSPYRIDIRDLLPARHRLPNNAELNFTPKMQLAQDRGEKIAAELGHPLQVFVPIEGKYRISADLIPRNRVGIAGLSMDETVFFPTGPVSFLRKVIPLAGTTYNHPTYGSWTTNGYDYPPWETQDYEDNYYSDFHVNCTHQTALAGGIVKAFYIMRMLGPRFERIRASDTWNTMFGNDFLDRAVYLDCEGIRAGRAGIGSTNWFGTGATFGIATGLRPVERWAIINGRSDSPWSHHIFTERATARLASRPGHPAGGYFSRGGMIVNPSAKGGRILWFNAGSSFAQWIGGQGIGQEFAAAYFSGNETAGYVGGHGDLIIGPQIEGAGWSPPPGRTGGAVVWGNSPGYGHEIQNLMAYDVANGYVFEPSDAIGPGQTIRGGQIIGAKGSGFLNLRPPGEANALRRLTVDGVQFVNSGQNPTATYRDGFRSRGDLINARLNDITTVDEQAVKTMVNGFHLEEGATITDSWIERLFASGAIDQNFRHDAAEAGTNYIERNIY